MNRVTKNITDLLRASHGHHINAITEGLGVDVERGLPEDEVAERRERFGANVLKEILGDAWWQILLSQFTNIVVWLLAFATITAWLTNGPLEAAAILIVFVLNALVGFALEWQAGRALDALKRETPLMVRVRREGREVNIEASGLVAGDVVVLAAGDRVPADVRLIEAVNLHTDESTLTGESVPVSKSIEAVDLASLLAERRSMLYLGTMVTSGRALGVVTATGNRTELGRIGQLISKANPEKTPLEKKLARLGAQLVYVVLAIAVIVMLVGFWRGDDPWLMLKVSISLAVAAVPEGLPAVTTLILALGVLRIARRNAIVRRLAAVEALGSTTVICTDKTGTLTENRLTVEEYRLSDGRVISLSNPDSKSSLALENARLLRLLTVSIMCNDASYSCHDSEERFVGDPTETALLSAVNRLGFDVQSERTRCKKLLERPFDSVSKRMITVVENTKDHTGTALMKGAPAVVLEACSHFVDKLGETIPLTDEKRLEFLHINEEMAGRGLRVLAFADKQFDLADLQKVRDEQFEKGTGYTFLGLSGMSDPLREGAAEAVQKAREAGIRVVMLTGDQLKTAHAIAERLDLASGESISALHANDITDADSDSLTRLAQSAHVFARVSPEDKLRIVEALQGAGEIVAVTGDGINDAPALKRADIGIAMGKRGTDVAKEAADIVLTDDNFSTIIKAVEGGRTIYSNIIKFVHLMFTENLAEVLVIFVAIAIGLPLPLLPLQILWVNLITDVFPAMALAVEPSSPDNMKRAPRKTDEPLLSRRFLFLIGWQALLLAMITIAAYLWALRSYGEGPHARTVAMLSIVGVQLGHLYNCRSQTRSAFNGFFKNPAVFAASAVVIILQVFAIYFEPVSGVLDLDMPNRTDWLVILLCLILPVIVVEIAKIFMRR